MQSSVIAYLGFIIIAGLVVLVPVLIGTYVYKDAKSRGMDAVLWTLVAILVPSFIGLIIYLVVRGSSPGLRCPGCGNPVAWEFALCPYCGMALKASCPSCAAPVGDGWKLCPQCGAELPEQAQQSAIPAPPKKDRRLTWILVAAVVLPVAILVLGIIGMVGFRSIGSSTQTMGTGFGLSAEEGFVPDEVVRWMERCDAVGKGVYALRVSPEKTVEMNKLTIDGQTPADVYFVFIYLNWLAPGTGYMGEAQLNKKTVAIAYHSTPIAEGKSPGYELSEITATGEKVNDLKITIDGVTAKYTLEELL